jgi:hypothetical protein
MLLRLRQELESGAASNSLIHSSRTRARCRSCILSVLTACRYNASAIRFTVTGYPATSTAPKKATVTNTDSPASPDAINITRHDQQSRNT